MESTLTKNVSTSLMFLMFASARGVLVRVWLRMRLLDLRRRLRMRLGRWLWTRLLRLLRMKFRARLGLRLRTRFWPRLLGLLPWLRLRMKRLARRLLHGLRCRLWPGLLLRVHFRRVWRLCGLLRCGLRMRH